MRITNQILAKTAAKSKIPLQQSSLLDVLNRKGTSNDLLSSLQNTSKNKVPLPSNIRKHSKELEKTADSLSTYASKLNDDGENSLFAKAEETQDNGELISNIESMVSAYNKTLEQLGESDGTLNSLYLQELKNAAAEKSAALKAVGITRKKDGSLDIDKEILQKADLDSLKAVFGSGSGFTDKIGYLGSRVSANAQAQAESLLSGYGADGMSYFNSFEANKYNFWG